MGQTPSYAELIDPDSFDMLVDTRHDAPGIAPTSATAAYAQVLEHAGASCGLECDGSADWDAAGYTHVEEFLNFSLP
ncbi:MAG: hypothetical protein V3T07_04365 [Myxococcota bacterium]